MHGKYAFARIETVTERRRLRRLFFCVFLLPIACTLPAVAVTKARLLQKLSLCPLQIVRKNNFFGVAIQAFSCFCQALCFASSFLHWKGVFRLSETGSNACAKYKRVLVFFIFGKSGAIGFFVLLFWAKFHFITSIFSGKNNQTQINIRL